MSMKCQLNSFASYHLPASDDDGDAAFHSIDCDAGIVTRQELKVKVIDIDVGLTWRWKKFSDKLPGGVKRSACP